MTVTGTRRDPAVEPTAPGATEAHRTARARLLHLLLPLPCLGCSAPLPSAAEDLHLCLVCRGRLMRHRPGCPRCGEPYPERRRGAEPCADCRRRPPAFRRFVAPWVFAPPLDSVLHHLKFRRRGDLGERVARPLAAWLRQQRVAERERLDLVVPVPLHPWRRLRRGYNQADRLARPLSEDLGLPFAPALRRARATPPQTTLPRARRRTNLEGAFAVRRAWHGRLAGRRVLLVDDVATTGATLDAAARALRRGGASRVVAVAAARTPVG
jgi:ComF family protein